jgi:hypothetical protein
MKANLLSLFCLLSVSFALCFAAHPNLAVQTGPTSAPTQTDASADSNIKLENWAKPQSGWLYVLDPKPEAVGPGGRIWLLDPQTAKVMGSIRTGDNADFALSPDGSRLYVASIIEGDSSELAVIDTAQGAVLQRGSVEDREVANVLPSFSAMAVSGDGLVLRVLIDTPKSADADSFLLAAFDTRTGDFLPKSVHLGNCGLGRFISYPTADRFNFLCPRTEGPVWRWELARKDASTVSGRP